MSDEQQKEKRPLSMTRRYRRGLVIVGLLCMMVTLAIATVLFQRSYTVRVDKYLSQICDTDDYGKISLQKEGDVSADEAVLKLS